MDRNRAPRCFVASDLACTALPAAIQHSPPHPAPAASPTEWRSGPAAACRAACCRRWHAASPACPPKWRRCAAGAGRGMGRGRRRRRRWRGRHAGAPPFMQPFEVRALQRFLAPCLPAHHLALLLRPLLAPTPPPLAPLSCPAGVQHRRRAGGVAAPCVQPHARGAQPPVCARPREHSRQRGARHGGAGPEPPRPLVCRVLQEVPRGGWGRRVEEVGGRVQLGPTSQVRGLKHAGFHVLGTPCPDGRPRTEGVSRPSIDSSLCWHVHLVPWLSCRT